MNIDIDEIIVMCDKMTHAGNAPVMPLTQRLETFNEWQLKANPETVKALCERIKELETRKFIVKQPFVSIIGHDGKMVKVTNYCCVIQAIREAGGEVEDR